MIKVGPYSLLLFFSLCRCPSFSIPFTLRVSKFTFLHNVAAAAGIRDRCASLTYFLRLVFREPPLESIFTPCPSLPPLQRQSRST
jgi:hypothetical protein